MLSSFGHRQLLTPFGIPSKDTTLLSRRASDLMKVLATAADLKQ